jgi:hypothetical protein
VGCGRSGTTLLLSVLSSDTRLYCINNETEAFKHGFLAHPGPPGIMYNAVDSCSEWQATIAKFRLLLAITRQAAPAFHHCRIVEKTPIHIRTVSCIRKAYGGRIRFIHIVRDGRDVVTSLHPSSPDRFHIHPERWVYDAGITESCRNDDDTTVVRYEDLIADFEETMANIYATLEMELPESISSYWQHAKVRRHVAWPSEVKGLSSKGIGRWKQPAYAERVDAFLAVPGAGRLLKVFGYEV